MNAKFNDASMFELCSGGVSTMKTL